MLPMTGNVFNGSGPDLAPYNLRMVRGVIFTVKPRDAGAPQAVFELPYVQAAAATSLGQRAAAAAVDERACIRTVATTAVVPQMTRQESAGYRMRVVPPHSDRSTGGWRPANSTLCGCAAAADKPVSPQQTV